MVLCFSNTQQPLINVEIQQSKPLPEEVKKYAMAKNKKNVCKAELLSVLLLVQNWFPQLCLLINCIITALRVLIFRSYLQKWGFTLQKYLNSTHTSASSQFTRDASFGGSENAMCFWQSLFLTFLFHQFPKRDSTWILSVQFRKQSTLF